MTERDILLHPILASVYNHLIEGTLFPAQALKIKRQVINLIKQLLLSKMLDYYHAPKFFYLTLAGNVTDKLRTCLKQRYERLGQKISDEQLEEAINSMIAAIDLFTTQQIAKDAKND